MHILETILLGIIQGLTEFLPISSSGHLVVAQNLLGFRQPDLLLDTSLHLGTLLAVCAFFRSDLKRMIVALFKKKFNDPHAAIAYYVVLASIPTAIIGLVFKDTLEKLFGSPTMVGFMLLATGIIVASTRFLSRDRRSKHKIDWVIALAIGTAQGLAIIPGISRSGATIVCGLLFGLNRDLAGRYSFLLSIPAILGATLLQINLRSIERIGMTPLLSGFTASAIVGIFALTLLMGMVRKGKLYYFTPYCWMLGILVIFFS